MNSQENPYATGAFSAWALIQYAGIRNLYPNALSDAEAIALHENLAQELERVVHQPEGEGLVSYFVRPHFENTAQNTLPGQVGLAFWKALCRRLGLDEGNRAAVRDKAYDQASSLVRSSVERLSERYRFDCRIPHPSSQPIYSSPARHLFLLKKYWETYQSIVTQHGQTPVGWTPHPLLRYIVNLQDRITTCLSQVGTPELTAAINTVLEIGFGQDMSDGFEDLVAPLIAYACESLAKEELLAGSRSFELTFPEELFFSSAAAALSQLEAEASKAMKQIVDRSASTLSQPKVNAPPSTCFELIGRVEQVLRDMATREYKTMFGARWPEEVQTIIGNEAYAAIQQTMQQRHATDVDDLLAFSQLKDVYILVSQQWQRFQRLTPNGRRKDFNELMAIVLKGRTEEAHNRPSHLWPEIEKQRVRVACHDVLKMFASGSAC